MTKRIGIRELARNTKILDEYDVIEIEDKRNKEFKGIFVSAKWAKWVEEEIEKKKAQEAKKRAEKILRFAGMLDGEIADLSAKDIRKKRAMEIAKRGKDIS